MTLWQPGMRITAARLLTYTRESTTTGLVAESGWSVNDFDGYKVSGVCTVRLYVQRTGSTITATNGNIPDTLMCTLPAGYRPPSTLSAVWGDGTASGEAIATLTGAVTLRTASSDIATGRNIRLTLSFVL